MTSISRIVPAILVAVPAAALSDEPCRVGPERASLTIPHVDTPVSALNADPESPLWKGRAQAPIFQDCTRKVTYLRLRTEVRAFWTDKHLYFLFICPYSTLNVFLPADDKSPRDKLWDRDVVEIFLGDDWNNIRHYREFEIAPTGDWIDLAIDLDKPASGRGWRSGWRTAARIDTSAGKWYAAASIPLKAVSPARVAAGTRWRMNLYRIDGEGPDSARRFLCWQPTCAPGRDPNHVPEAFGTLIFGR